MFTITMETPDLPILGAPLGIELANTRYGAGADAIDFLADLARSRHWVRLAVGRATIDDWERLRELRDAIHAALQARAAGGAPDARTVAVINRHAAAGCAAAVLSVQPDGAATAAVRFRGAGALRARLATSCIELLTGPHPIRRCEGAGCGLFFVQQHGRRRFCSDGCSHRERQQRYRTTHA